LDASSKSRFDDQGHSAISSMEEPAMVKLIYSDAGASAAEYGLIAGLSLLATIAGLQSVGITLAAIVQTAAVSLSLSI
jgi:Flp pilus assembly pilin Flp